MTESPRHSRSVGLPSVVGAGGVRRPIRVSRLYDDGRIAKLLGVSRGSVHLLIKVNRTSR